MTRITGEDLNHKWKVGARQPRFSKTGRFYMLLERFPGALFDPHGYVLFKTKEEYEQCPLLQHGNPESENQRLNVVRPGISAIPGYVKIE